MPAPAPAPPPAAALKSRARIARVVDGDTLRVTLAGVRRDVQLLGVDAPEPPACGGKQAAAQMLRLVLRTGRGRLVTLIRDPAHRETDGAGRLVAYVSGGGRDLGRALIAAGWATTRAAAGGFRRLERYRDARAAARAARRGVWRRCAGNFNRVRR